MQINVFPHSLGYAAVISQVLTVKYIRAYAPNRSSSTFNMLIIELLAEVLYDLCLMVLLFI